MGITFVKKYIRKRVKKENEQKGRFKFLPLW